MDKRPLSQSVRQWLLDEIGLWRGQGIVSEDQAEAILDLYETPTQSSARQQSIAIYMLVGIAAIFVGLAAFLLIGLSWEFLPNPLKLFVLLGAVMGVYGLGFCVRYVWNARTFSEFAFFLGGLFYGGAMALIAEIFNIHEHPANGFFWWAVGLMPIALFLDTLLMHLLTVSILAAWVGVEILSAPPGHLFGLVPHGCFTLPIFAGLGLCWAYRKNSPTTVGLYVPLVAWWLTILPLAWSWSDNPIFFIGGVGAILLMLAEIHPEGSRFAIPYRLYGAVLCMGVLCVLGFHEVHRDLVRLQNVEIFVGQSLAVTMLAGLVFAVAFAVHARRAESSLERPIYTFFVRQWLPLAMVVLMLLMTLWYAMFHGAGNQFDASIALVPTVLANIGMLILAFWLMMFGLREERGFPAAGGVVFFLLWTVCRYAEWFGSKGELLGAACMFFVCGAAIFGFAMYWHQRKKQRERVGHERDE